MKPVLYLWAILLGTSACSSQQGYHSAQNWQRGECNKVIDQSERSACLANTNTSYDDYKRESGKLQQRP